MKKKLGDKADLIDLESQNAFSTKKAKTLMIKCVNSLNPCGVRNAKMNTKTIHVCNVATLKHRITLWNVQKNMSMKKIYERITSRPNEK